MSEYDSEPIRGLPGLLPPGEVILWQGSPDWRVLARTAFHTGSVAVYFAVLVAVALVSGSALGFGMTLAVGMIGIALLHLLAYGTARSTIYTITNRRIVLRFGMAIPKCINLPLRMIGTLDLRARARGTGDLLMLVTGQQRLGYIALWPHAQGWHFSNPRPMLRAVPEIAKVGMIAARAAQAAQGDGIVTAVADVTPTSSTIPTQQAATQQALPA
ncbi:MAG: photosynthetic complex assembly protein [Sphingomonas sp.]|nr:photosynthetic complex assembly protein [Sphingomonas sp.]